MSGMDQHTEQTDFEFWEFVVCSKCQLSFSLGGNATIPFWLTDCGHVLCNDHLQSDQSCSYCGSQGIQLAPLQRQMDAPMSDWFRSVASALDSVAFAAKFQQETMASQIRHFKRRHQQFRHLVERMKRDIAELKKTNAHLQNENDSLRMQVGHPRHDGQISSSISNPNGKRPMMSMQNFDHDRRPSVDSSPRSITTPVGPNRLTLMPGQQLPELSTQKQHNHQSQSMSLEQFAYSPRGQSHFHLPQLTHVQAAPRIFQQSIPPTTEMPLQSRTQTSSHGQPSKPPQPPSSRFKPAPTPHLGNLSLGQVPRQQNAMPPPPTPLHIRQQISSDASTSGTRNLRASSGQNAPPNRLFQPPSHHHQLVASSGRGQVLNTPSRRFFPATAQGSSTSSPMPGGSRNIRPSLPNGGSQRMEFIPDNGQQGCFR